MTSFDSDQRYLLWERILSQILESAAVQWALNLYIPKYTLWILFHFPAELRSASECVSRHNYIKQYLAIWIWYWCWSFLYIKSFPAYEKVAISCRFLLLKSFNIKEEFFLEILPRACWGATASLSPETSLVLQSATELSPSSSIFNVHLFPSAILQWALMHYHSPLC